MNIRPAISSDISQLLPLLQKLFSIEEDFVFDAVKATAALSLLMENSSATVLVAECETGVCGMVSGQLTISTAEGGHSLLAEDLVVVDAFQKRGVATKLLKSLAVWGGEKGATRMQLLADKNNEKALEFYKKRGWQTTQLICLRSFAQE